MYTTGVLGASTTVSGVAGIAILPNTGVSTSLVAVSIVMTVLGVLMMIGSFIGKRTR